MKLLYIGDIMADLGIQTVEQVLPDLVASRHIDFVVAQAENVTAGRGITPADMQRLQACGVQAFTGGNWSLYREEIIDAMNDPEQPIVRPANYPVGTPGKGYKYIGTGHGKVLVISLLGQIVGRDADKPVDNPLRVVDNILESEAQTTRVATIVNFHGDYSSEKVIIGHYLDGRVTMVVGDHWHVPTADARVQPGGTAHMSDVGMCGALDASLGVAYSSVVARWRDGIQSRNIMETIGQRQFNGLLVETDSAGLATSAEHIRRLV